MILAGDIGGTKTHLALFEGVKIVAEKKYPSQEFPGLEEIACAFLKEAGSRVERACFGIAGPIRNNRCQATNLPWVIDGQTLAEKLGAEAVFLINDLEANAYGLRRLSPDEFFTLNAGDPHAQGNQALISAGTGLGEAGLYWDGRTHQPFACEGGHADFGPRSEIEMELLRYLHKRYGHVSYERVLSGPGLHNLYKFLIELRLEKEGAPFGDLDPAKEITQRALQNSCPASLRAIEWFTKIYGSEAGNLALKTLALGGLFVGGGIAPKILSFLKEGTFMDAFIDKGRFAPLLKEIPVKVVLNDKTALLGAALYAEEKK